MSTMALQRVRRTASAVLAAAIVGTGLAACGSSDDDTTTAASGSNAAETTKLRVPFTAGFGTLPVHVAAQKGFFEKHGLDIELTEGLQLPAYLAAMGRQYDIVMATPAGLIDAASKGLKAQAVSHVQVVDDEHKNQVLVSKEPVESIASLKGKRIGVPTLTGTSALAVLYLMKEAGVDPKDVKLIQSDYPNMPDQLKAGRLDAVTSAIPFYSALEDEGYALGDDVTIKAVEQASNGATSQAIGALFVSSPTFVEQNQQAVEGFRAALADAIEWIGDNDAEAREMVESWLKVPAEVAKTAPLPGFGVDITAEELEPFVTISRSVGGLETELSATDLVWPGAAGK